MSESTEKERIRDWLTEIGAWHFPVNNMGYGWRGIPDRIACIRGTMVAIEVKSRGKKPTNFQLIQLEACRQAGGVAILAYSLEDVQLQVRAAGLQ